MACEYLYASLLFVGDLAKSAYIANTNWCAALVGLETRVKLTSNYHHDYGEHFLVVRFGRHISKADRSHAGHGEVKGRNVHGPFVGAADKIARKRHVLGDGLEWRLGVLFCFVGW